MRANFEITERILNFLSVNFKLKLPQILYINYSGLSFSFPLIIFQRFSKVMIIIFLI